MRPSDWMLFLGMSIFTSASGGLLVAVLSAMRARRISKTLDPRELLGPEKPHSLRTEKTRPNHGKARSWLSRGL